MTRKQKQSLALALIQQAANLVEFPDMLPEELVNVDTDDIRKTLNQWLKTLPGTDWDVRLGTTVGSKL